MLSRRELGLREWVCRSHLPLPPQPLGVSLHFAREENPVDKHRHGSHHIQSLRQPCPHPTSRGPRGAIYLGQRREVNLRVYSTWRERTHLPPPSCVSAASVSPGGNRSFWCPPCSFCTCIKTRVSKRNTGARDSEKKARTSNLLALRCHRH